MAQLLRRDRNETEGVRKVRLPADRAAMLGKQYVHPLQGQLPPLVWSATARSCMATRYHEEPGNYRCLRQQTV